MRYRGAVRRAALLLFVACARAPATPAAAPSTEPVPEAIPAPPEANAETPADPVATLRARLPERRGWDGELLEPDIGQMWHDLGEALHAMAPGPERDELLRIGLAAAAAWPDDKRVAPNGWNELWVTGGVPFAWPLVRSVRINSLEQTRALLAGEALAQVTDLTLYFSQFADVCERPNELFDLLAAARHLGRVRSLSLALPNCVPPEMLARLAAAKPALTALRRLVLPGWIGPRGAAVLAESPLLAQLEELDLSNSKPQRAGLAALGRSPHLQLLKKLRLHYSLDSTDAGLALVDTPAWIGLRELDLSTNVLTRATLEGLGRNPALIKLEVLDIGGSRGQGDARFAGFARAGGLPGLRVLRINQVQLGDAELVELLGAHRWSGLRELDLSTNKIGPAGAASLARATHLTALERIDLDQNRLGAKGGAALAGAAHLAGLRHLDLTNCEIGEPATTKLLSSLRNPEVLLLSSNAIGDGGAKAIAARSEWTRLRTLELGGNAIGPDGAVALAGATHLATLEKILIRGNPVGERGWRALVASQPLARFVDAYWRRQLALLDTTLSPEDAGRKIPSDFEIVLRHGGCHGSCPVFTISVRADGRLDYRGDRHVTVTGPVQERVDPTRIRLILAAIDTFLVTEPGRYPAPGGGCTVHVFDTDLSVRITRDGQSAVYTNENICPTAPAHKALFHLAARVGALLDTARWMPVW